MSAPFVLATLEVKSGSGTRLVLRPFFRFDVSEVGVWSVGVMLAIWCSCFELSNAAHGMLHCNLRRGSEGERGGERGEREGDMEVCLHSLPSLKCP